MSDGLADFALESYRFDLPAEQIAQYPPEKRGDSRLMVLNRRTGAIAQGVFTDILQYLPENCLLVANNSRVTPARLNGNRASGGNVEMLLLTPLPLLQAKDSDHGWRRAEADVLLRPVKKLRQGEVISFSPQLHATLLSRAEFGQCRVELAWQGDMQVILDDLGSMPLPPYIRRTDQADKKRYQTVYADQTKTGSVAAPTAGLHFTRELHAALTASGREWAELTLYVGYGTFSPVRCQDIRQHPMHPEYVELSAQTAARINNAKQEGRPVVAVGTTSCRVLEGLCAAQQPQSPLQAHTGWLNIFLYPGKRFHVIDGLITNFHLPESSLLMLVSAFAGRERILQAYHTAINAKFRFFSYGDAMLIV